MGVCGTPWQLVDVDTVWPRISGRIPASTPEPDGIRLECQRGTALCLECADGVLIITLTPSEHGALELFILLCVGYRAGAFQRCDPDLDKFAADLGASSIAWCPRRKGWERLARQTWRRHGDTFTREVTHGGQAGGRQADTPATRTG